MLVREIEPEFRRLNEQPISDSKTGAVAATATISGVMVYAIILTLGETSNVFSAMWR